MKSNNLKLPFSYAKEPNSELQSDFVDIISQWGVKLLKYKNEIDTIRELNSQKYKIRQDKCKEYFGKLSQAYDETIAEHKNWVAVNYYKESLRFLAMDQKANALIAVQTLTNAILHAPLDSKVLMCSYIMRSKALYYIGYYRHSFEDCKVASKFLENRDARNFLEHVLALKLEDVRDMEVELLVLRMQMQIAQHGRDGKMCSTLKEMLDKYKNIKEPSKIVESLDKVSFHNKKMVAKKDIKPGDPIISEAPYVLYAYADSPTKICTHCGSMHWISYPCHRCGSDKVLYCSQACKELHKTKHIHECEFFKLNMQKMVSIETVLALRTTIYALIEMTPHLTNKLTATSMWSHIFGEFNQQEQTAYSKFLKLCIISVSTDKRNLDERLRQSLEAELLITFLLERTSVVKLLERTRAKKDQWQIFLSAILLYNMQQIKSHARCMVSILDYNWREFPEKRFLKSGGITAGQLSDMNRNVTQLAIAMYIHMGRCGSDTARRMTLTHQNCRTLNMFAAREIRRGEEIVEFLYPVKPTEKKLDKWIKREFELIRVLLHPAVGCLPMEENSLKRILAIGMNALMKIKTIHGHLSPIYIKYMLYVWDVIAIGKMPIERDFMRTCLEALQIMAKMEQDIIMNYFRKYLSHLLIKPLAKVKEQRKNK